MRDLETLRQRVLEKIRTGKTGLPLPRPPRSELPEYGEFPATPAQTWLWSLQQAEINSTAYNMPFAFRIPGHIPNRALEDCLRELIRRHSSLRTSFYERGGRLFQAIGSGASFHLRVSHLPGRDQIGDEEILDSIGYFDLSRGPLLRAEVIETGTCRFLIADLHHIVGDGWSVKVLLDDFALLLDAWVSPQKPAPPADFTAYHQYISQGAGEEIRSGFLKFWKDYLAGADPILRLADSKQANSAASYRGRKLMARLDPVPTKKLLDCAKACGTSAFTVILAVFGGFLSRLSGQRTFTIAVPVSLRSNPESLRIAGPMINTIPVRWDAREGMSFLDCIRSAQKSFGAAWDHKDILLPEILTALGSTRAPGIIPFSQVMLVEQNQQIDDNPLIDQGFVPLDLPGRTSKYDLSLSYRIGAKGLSMSWEFRTGLYTEAQVRNWIDAFCALLEARIELPAHELAKAPMVAEAEMEASSAETAWSKSEEADKAGNTTLNRLLDEARRNCSASRLALIGDGGTMSYDEYRSTVARMASVLRFITAPKVNPIIAVCMERGFNPVITLSAIIHTGGAFLPINPDWPTDRIQYVMRDANPALLVLDASTRSLFGSMNFEVPVFDMDDGKPEIQAAPEMEAFGGTSPDHGAYLLYTSGSTGRPKGVLNNHGAICNRLLWQNRAIPLGPEDRTIQKTTYVFDVSVWEFFWFQISGTTLAVPRHGGERDPKYLAEFIRRHRVTVSHFVPSMLEQFVAEPEANRCHSLRTIICSGEALTVGLASRAAETLQGSRVFNLYGPTEAAIDVSIHRYTGQEKGHTVPIGKPIWNTSLYILDKDLRPVPLGTPGELYIGGIGLATGYPALPGLTAEKFLADPFSTGTGSRMYRSGDTARMEPDGSIVFEGRNDHQVKIRGVRIELEEIERKMEEHPEVRQSVAIAVQSSYLDQKIVLFVTARNDSAALPDRLLGFLRVSLPAYMLPAKIQILNSLPLGGTGKLDRKALEVMANSEVDVLAGPPAPGMDPLGQEIHRIFSDILKPVDIDPAASFFSLGGNSLQAVVLLRRIRELGFDLELSDFLANQNVFDLSRLLSGRPRRHQEASWPAIEARSEAVVEWKATSIQTLMIRLYAESRTSCLRYHFVQRLGLEGDQIDIPAFRRALASVVDSNANFRLRFEERKEGIFCALRGGVEREPDLEVVELGDIPEESRAQFRDACMARERTIRFDAFAHEKPLYRFTLLTEAGGKATFIYAIHHAIFDGWSNIEFTNAIAAEYIRQKTEDLPRRTQPREKIPDLAALAVMEARAAEDGRQRDAWQGAFEGWSDLRLSGSEISALGPAAMEEIEVTISKARQDQAEASARKAGLFPKTVWLWAWMRSISNLYVNGIPLIWTVTSVRFPSMTDPMHSMGLFWTFRPVCFPRLEGSVLEELHGVQAGLSCAEVNCAYPLAALIEEHKGNIARQASFNYIHFRNSLDGSASGSGLNVAEAKSYDMFHFPLNLTVKVNPFSERVTLRVTWDPLEFRREEITERVRLFENLLGTLP